LGYFLNYISIFIWNLDNFWIFQVDKTGGILTLLLNSFIISLPFLLLVWVRKRSFNFRFMLFPVAYLFMELMHINWQLAFPLLTLGNGLANNPALIQWYEYTGVLGGSLWIILVNILIFKLLLLIIYKNATNLKRSVTLNSLYLMMSIGLPILISNYIFGNYHERGQEVEVVAVHSNIDCYSLKYTFTNEMLVNEYMNYTLSNITQNTEYIFWPETAIAQPVYIDSLNTSAVIKQIAHKLKGFPKVKLISGIVLREKIVSPTEWVGVREDKKLGCRFREYNAAIQFIPANNSIEIKTKHKCVPFTEVTPYPKFLSYFKKFIKSLGGYSFATSEKYGYNLFYAGNNICVRPMICYESVFPDANPGKGGGSFNCVILNEGWYKNLKVSAQFMYLSGIRAIEGRRCIVRSSNVGISGMVSQKGESSNTISIFGKNSFRSKVFLNNKQTFYSRYKAVIEIMIIASFLLFAAMLVLSKLKAVIKKVFA
jgi:apolipoprotein N-acyltransferase